VESAAATLVTDSKSIQVKLTLYTIRNYFGNIISDAYARTTSKPQTETASYFLQVHGWRRENGCRGDDYRRRTVSGCHGWMQTDYQYLSSRPSDRQSAGSFYDAWHRVKLIPGMTAAADQRALTWQLGHPRRQQKNTAKTSISCPYRRYGQAFTVRWSGCPDSCPVQTETWRVWSQSSGWSRASWVVVTCVLHNFSDLIIAIIVV